MQFTTSLSAENLESLRKVLLSAYPHVENRLAWNVAIGPGTFKVDHAPAGLKMSSENALDIVVLYPQGITNSRLAPYNSWHTFRERAHHVVTRCLKEIGNRPAKRLGVRYINRIDIPSQQVRVDEWLRLGITSPASLPSALTSYGLHVSLMLTDQIRLTLQSNSVESPLIQHNSVLLDIDVYIADVMINRSEIWEKIDELRQQKNVVFEACITDKTRELFDRI